MFYDYYCPKCEAALVDDYCEECSVFVELARCKRCFKVIQSGQEYCFDCLLMTTSFDI